FVWGDMVVRPDRRFQDAVNTERALLARAAGCAESLIEENFRKEAEDDTPWTIHETLTALRRIGFRNPDCNWSAGAFAVFAAQR
ncbi:MAG: hypothetical protein L0271_14885, partial [Gemmatimonadetes bacterium]|nr:hypothetical protein [Gemmatimonadota bacterium]